MRRHKTPGNPEPEDVREQTDQLSFTVEVSRIMPLAEGFVQAWDVQATVNIGSHLMVENHITQQTNDKQQIEPVME